MWVEILLDKFFSHRPTERLLSHWRLIGLDVAAGTVAGGLQRLEPLFEPLYRALLRATHSRRSPRPMRPAGWSSSIRKGKTGHRW